MRMTKTEQQEQSPDALKESEVHASRKHGARLLRFRPRKIVRRNSPGESREAPPEASPQHARTAILTSYDPFLQAQQSFSSQMQFPTQTMPSTSSDEEEQARAETSRWSSAIRSFQFCGRTSDVLDVSDDEDMTDNDDDAYSDIPDDPTIQESIECVFAHQLEEGGLPLNDELDRELVSPASFLQSRTQGRNSRLPTSPLKKRPYHAGSLVHMGTYDPALGKVVPPPPVLEASLPEAAAPTVVKRTMCDCQRGIHTPLVPPEDWPQRPLLLRPTPGSGTRVIGIRFSSSQTYLWTEGDACDEIVWSRRLEEHWKRPVHSKKSPTCCSECMILPINNGNEPRGEALVVDFESPLFCGTILVRVRHSEGTTPTPYDDSKGYFAGMNRRYQIVIRGHFKKQIPWTQCVAGMQLERPAGKMPPKWITHGALRVVSFFAPQLKANFDGDRPYSVTPFGSTPQTLRMEEHSRMNETMEDMQHEPIHDAHTILHRASSDPSSLTRARFRKKHFDKLYVAQSSTPVTLTEKVYTFEFLQHLLNFHDFCIELGSMLGHVSLQETLDGQPLQIMARHGDDDKIWAFDVWHECLVEDSKKYDML